MLAAGCQSSFIYFPRKAPESALAAEATAQGMSAWRDAGGGWLGWRRAPTEVGAKRALVFHGNAGCGVDRAYFADALAAKPGGVAWETAIAEYPGYGAKAGAPSEKSFRAAATVALDALLAERAEPVVLVGESIGTGVACWLAGERPNDVAGVLLVTPFSSFVEVAAAHFPWLPVRWLLRDRYDSCAALKSYHGPIVVVLAGRDEVVPMRLGQKLYDDYAGPKRLVVQPESTHNTVDLRPVAAWWSAALRFVVGGYE